jgi:integrase
MEIIKTKDGVRYREMLWINGKAFKGPRFLRKSDAKEWKALQSHKKRDVKLFGEEQNLDGEKPFSLFADEWLLGKIHISKQTQMIYESTIRVHLRPFFNDLPIDQIKKSDGEKLINKLKQSGHNAKGVNNILAVLKSMLIDAKKTEAIQKNPLEYLAKVPAEINKEAYWTKAEIDQFLRANAFNELYHFYIVALNTGMRRGELAGLCWDRVDFATEQITITRTMDMLGLKETTKTKLKRVVPMNPVVKRSLFALMKMQRNEKFVFTESDGSQIDVHHLYRKFKIDQRRAGITNLIRFHDLRHTFASQFMMAGGNIFDLQKILGHSKNDMTQRYAHLSPEHLASAIKIISFSGDDFENVNLNLTRELKIV